MATKAEKDAVFAREFPEHHKLEGHDEEKRAIESFLCDLESKGHMIMRYRTEEEKERWAKTLETQLEEDLRDIDARERKGEITRAEAGEERREREHQHKIDMMEKGHVEDQPINVRFRDAVAEYYDIDQNAFEKEKRKMLDAVRCREIVG